MADDLDMVGAAHRMGVLVTYPLDMCIEEQGSTLAIQSDLSLEVRYFVKFWCTCMAYWYEEGEPLCVKPCDSHRGEVWKMVTS